jgi:hypothetical protein
MSDTSDQHDHSRVSTAFLICGTIGFLAVLGGYFYLAINRLDTTAYLGFVVAIAALIPGTAAWKNSNQIMKQTNGPLTKTNDTVNNIDTKINVIETAMHHRMDSLEEKLLGVSNRVVNAVEHSGEVNK